MAINPPPRNDKQPTRTLFWCELVCGHCNSTTAGQWVASKVPIRSLKREAQSQGWVFLGTESFCSKAHLSAWKEDQEKSR